MTDLWHVVFYVPSGQNNKKAVHFPEEKELFTLRKKNECKTPVKRLLKSSLIIKKSQN